MNHFNKMNNLVLRCRMLFYLLNRELAS